MLSVTGNCVLLGDNRGSVTVLNFAMAMRINPPEFNTSKGYERYKLELLAWKEVTSLEVEKQGIAIALSLPEDAGGIREKVFDELSLTDLKTERGLSKLIDFMDKTLGKDDLEDSLDKFEDFEDYSRDANTSISDYIINFDQKYNRIVKKGMSLPSEILAFKLLRRANITRQEKLLVMTGMNYDKKSTLYEQARKSLRKFKGDSGGNSSSTTAAIKLEPAFLSEHEEALWAAGYVYRGYRGRGRGYFRGGRGRAANNNIQVPASSSFQIPASGSGTKPERAVNPLGFDGQPLTCRSCGSFRHLIRDCPHSWENMAAAKSVQVVSEGDINKTTNSDSEKNATQFGVLYTAYDRQNMAQLCVEASGCAVLDSGCSSTVCGHDWFNSYMSNLEPQDYDKVIRNEGVKTFKFGGGTKLKSLGEYIIPAHLAGKDVDIKTDVVDSDIPLLMSRTAMKKAGMKLDLTTDRAEIFGEPIDLNVTSSGHYCVPIDKVVDTPVSSICVVNLSEAPAEEKRKVILKLHRQFAHPSSKKLTALMKDAGIWAAEYQSIVDDIYSCCDLCKRYAMTPARPVVSLPLANNFNDKVAMDLKQWGDKWILHIIDMWSRFSVSTMLDRKRPSDVIDNVVRHWIGVFGVMKSILTDNGGEFSSDETRDIASVLNIKLCTTAAQSPWSNGLCERVHAVIDSMLVKLIAEYPETALDILLSWANMAKNTLQMWNGYSSYQLVFGQNPNLPNIMSDSVPALDGCTASEVLAKHLNALHSARRAFMQTEACERIRRALRSKVRAAEQVFENGDEVYYKRDGRERWLGPGKVVFQDGKVIFIRHGGIFVRVSPNRVTKVNVEVADTSNSDVMDKSNPNPEKGCDMSGISSDGGNISEMIGDDPENGDYPVDVNAGGTATISMFPIKPNEVIEYRDNNTDQWRIAHVLGRAGKATGQYSGWYNVALHDSGDSLSVNLKDVEWRRVEHEVNLVLIPRDKQNTSECDQAKMAELEKLKLFGTYEEVDNQGQICISTKWVMWYKGSDIRARLVARGFEEDVELQKDSPTIGKSAIRIVLSIASSNNWTVKTTDIKSAFLQSKLIDRDVYIIPPVEACVSENKVWHLKRCLYGLNDAARQFYDSVVLALLNLGCTKSTLDPSLFFKCASDGTLIGTIVSHIDDFLHAGNREFEEMVIVQLRKRFLAGKLEEHNFCYVGFQMVQQEHGIILDQNTYVDRIRACDIPLQRRNQRHEQLNDKELTQLRQMAGKINWVVQGTRPDMAFELIELSTKFRSGTVADLVQAVKVIKRLKDFKCEVFFPNLGEPKYWRMVVFSDASHANLCDGVSSCGAHVIFLTGIYKTCCPLSWCANKIKRVVRSTIAAETMSLQVAIDEAIYLQNIMLEITKVSIPITAYVDNRSLVDALHSTKMVDEKRLRIDIASIKQSLQTHEIHNVIWCPGVSQLADCLTKRGAAGHHLLEVFHKGRLNLDID